MRCRLSSCQTHVQRVPFMASSGRDCSEATVVRLTAQAGAVIAIPTAMRLKFPDRSFRAIMFILRFLKPVRRQLKLSPDGLPRSHDCLQWSRRWASPRRGCVFLTQFAGAAEPERFAASRVAWACAFADS
jgi:hypothetical protein